MAKRKGPLPNIERRTGYSLVENTSSPQGSQKHYALKKQRVIGRKQNFSVGSSTYEVAGFARKNKTLLLSHWPPYKGNSLLASAIRPGRDSLSVVKGDLLHYPVWNGTKEERNFYIRAKSKKANNKYLEVSSKSTVNQPERWRGLILGGVPITNRTVSFVVHGMKNQEKSLKRQKSDQNHPGGPSRFSQVESRRKRG